MNNTERFFIELLDAFVNQRTPGRTDEQMDMVSLTELAKRQNVSGIIAYVLNKDNIFCEGADEDALTDEFFKTVRQYLMRGELALALCDMLSKAGVEHIVFKGLAIRDCYPVPELRTFSDVDIIIKKEDRSRVAELMKSGGFSCTVSDGGEVYTYSKGREHYEMHTSVNLSMAQNSPYMSSPWEHTSQDSGLTHRFDLSYHLCYLIIHIEKHVYGSGAGIRMYLDIALFIKKHRDQLDFSLVKSVLSDCSQEKFFNTVLYVCSRWFSLELPFEVAPLSDGIFEQLCDFTLMGGAFGDSTGSEHITDALRQEMSVSKSGAKRRMILKRIFPPGYELRRLYPWAEKRPLLLPAAWVAHLASAVKNNKARTVRSIAEADLSRAITKSEFFESIGVR